MRLFANFKRLKLHKTQGAIFLLTVAHFACYFLRDMLTIAHFIENKFSMIFIHMVMHFCMLNPNFKVCKSVYTTNTRLQIRSTHLRDGIVRIFENGLKGFSAFSKRMGPRFIQYLRCDKRRSRTPPSL